VEKTKSKDHRKGEEVLAWATEELHKALTNIIINMQNHPRPYFMLIHIKDSYDGRLGGFGHKVRNDLLESHHIPTPAEFVSGERIIDLSKKKVVHNVIVLMDKPPAVPMISTSLLRIDNKQGSASWIYILPPDKPVIWGCDMGEQNEFVFNSAAKSNAPIVN